MRQVLLVLWLVAGWTFGKLSLGVGRVSCGAGGTVPVNRVQALVNASRAYAMIILKRIVFMITYRLLFSEIAFVRGGAVKKTMPPVGEKASS